MSVTSVPPAEWLQTLCKAAPARLFPRVARNLPAAFDVDTYKRVKEAIGACIVPVNRRDFQPHSLTFSDSSSSDYAGDYMRMVLQSELAINPRPSREARSSRTAAMRSPLADRD